MLSVIMLRVAFYCYAEGPYAECHCAECHYAECRGAVVATMSQYDAFLAVSTLLCYGRKLQPVL
jgi:hypothetical protein